MKLILASTSTYRRALLERLGIPFDCVAPGVDETPFKSKGLAPEALAQCLAREKAQAVFARFPQALVIGGDQVAEVDGTILGKPGSLERAQAQLERMQGKPHRLLTALHLLGPGFDRPHLDVTTLHMRPLSGSEIQQYLLRDKPLDCAGSYKLEESGIKLFSKIETEDANAIVGVPLIWLQTALLEAGFSLFSADRR